MSLVLVNKGVEGARAWQGAAVLYDDGKLELRGEFAQNLDPTKKVARKKAYQNWTESPTRQLQQTPGELIDRFDEATPEQISSALEGNYVIEGSVSIDPKEAK